MLPWKPFTGLTSRRLKRFTGVSLDLPDGHLYTPETFASELSYTRRHIPIMRVPRSSLRWRGSLAVRWMLLGMHWGYFAWRTCQFGDQDSGENEGGAGEGARAEAFAGEGVGGQAGEDRFEREQ